MISITQLPLLLGMNALFAQETPQYPTMPTMSPAMMAVWLVVVVVLIAAMWKIFTKAGQPGWASIIPIYNWVVLCKIVGRPAWWVLLVLLCFPIFFIVLSIDLAKSFGKGVGFGLGLALLGVIFFPILGFGSATYQGPSAAPSA
jgi:hypothetical protein